MKIAIMQPYFFPYIGYFQLLSLVDHFVVYDNIEFTKKGWIHRNRILVDGHDVYISLPLKSDSDFLDVRDRRLADIWMKERKTLLNRVANAYRRAPNFDVVYSLFEKCILVNETNLFGFLYHSLVLINDYLQITTPLTVSSTLSIDHELKAGKKVLAICKTMHATDYVNPIGGLRLYDKADFKKEGVDLYLLQSPGFVYRQFGHDFVPNLSILDVMMFNSIEEIRKYLISSYTLI